MEALTGRGVPSGIEVGAQDGGLTWESLLLLAPVCPTLAYLDPLWVSTSWRGWIFPISTTSLSLCSLFLLWLARSNQRGWVGGGRGGGSLVWAAFPSAFPPGWDSSGSWKVDLGLRWIPVSSGTMVPSWVLLNWTKGKWLESPIWGSRDGS